jgi:hypothetical protein
MVRTAPEASPFSLVTTFKAYGIFSKVGWQTSSEAIILKNLKNLDFLGVNA